LPKLKNVLIVPLDWGLGHATRSIPLITNLLENNCTVYIAGETGIATLLQNEFHQIKILPLKGYRIQYSRQKRWLTVKILSQVPNIFFSIYREHRWLKRIVKGYSIDAVISDNRFGLYHSEIPCVYLTHQLLIKTGNRFIENILQSCHYWFIKKYTYCWVPDFKEENNLAGQLSHPKKMLPNVRYIGGLSRLQKTETVIIYDLMILLSGPEPQRTIFENLLMPQLQHFAGEILFVRGLPQSTNTIVVPKSSQHITVKNHLNASEISTAMMQSAMIICRSGYTTIMDLIKLKKKAILVPTPGQTEQEYLGEYLMKQQLFFCVHQKNFLLNDVLEATESFNFLKKEYNMEQYRKLISEFVGN
jgi:UDP-N-acetylglucosamine:LPS N-acetylglucosamine transferase